MEFFIDYPYVVVSTTYIQAEHFLVFQVYNCTVETQIQILPHKKVACVNNILLKRHMIVQFCCHKHVKYTPLPHLTLAPFEWNIRCILISFCTVRMSF